MLTVSSHERFRVEFLARVSVALRLLVKSVTFVHHPVALVDKTPGVSDKRDIAGGSTDFCARAGVDAL